MARNPLGHLCLLGVLALLVGLVVGCAGQDVGVFRPLTAVLKMKEPVRIGVTRVQLNPMQAPWDGFVRALSKKLDRPVQVVSYRPSQICSQLNKGYIDLAILSPTDYAAIGGDQTCVLLAKPVNTLDQTSRYGLIIVKRDSNLQTVAELKGRRFAFGPAGDATTDLSAAYVLMQAGLEPTDIPRELLPVPMTRRHHLDSFEVAKAVAYEPLLDAGVVDVVPFSTWQEKRPSGVVAATPIPMMMQVVAKEQFRVIAETPTLPEGPIVASKKTDPALTAAVREYLLSDEIPEEVLKPMEWRGFVAATPGEYEPAVRMVSQLRAAGWIAEGTAPKTPASEPAAVETMVSPTSAPATRAEPVASQPTNE